MVMQAMRAGASNKFIKTVFFGILMLAAIGLAFSGGYNPFDSSNVGSGDVAKIGNETISLNAFNRDLSRSLKRIGIGPQEAYQMGYVDRLLGSEVRDRILGHIASDNGIMIPRAHVAEQIQKIITPMTGEDRNPKDVLKQVLLSQGMSERELVGSISREMTVSLFGSALQAGFSRISPDLARALNMGSKETRDIAYVFFPDKEVKDVPPATDDKLREIYEGTKEAHAIPETRVLQLIKIKDESLKKTLEITDEELKQTYETNKDSYYTAPYHKLEQAILNDPKEAEKVYELIKGGQSMQAAVKDVTGKAVAYMGTGDVNDDTLVEDTKKPVMDAKEGALLPPIKTPLGWYVVRVLKADAGGTKPFEDVKKEIKDELYETKLADQRYDLAAALDDKLASGANPEEIGNEIDVEITTLPAVNSFGQGADGKDALKAYEKTASAILKTGFGLGLNETSPVSELADGTQTAIHVKSISDKSYKPFEDVKDSIAAEWILNNQEQQNKLLAATFAKSLEEGKSLRELAGQENKTVQTVQDIARNGEPKKPLTGEAINRIFSAEQGKPTVFSLEGGIAIAMVTGIHWPKTVDTGSDDYKKFNDALLAEIQNEALGLYIDQKSKTYNAKVNNALIRQAYGTQTEDR